MPVIAINFKYRQAKMCICRAVCIVILMKVWNWAPLMRAGFKAKIILHKSPCWIYCKVCMVLYFFCKKYLNVLVTKELWNLMWVKTHGHKSRSVAKKVRWHISAVVYSQQGIDFPKCLLCPAIPTKVEPI